MKKSIFFFLILMSGIYTFAQQTKISGKITNEKNQVLKAEVFAEGTNYFTKTDENGNFELNVDNATYNIVISSLGYKDQNKQIVASGQPIQLDLQFKKEEVSKDSKQLKEVTVVGKSNKKTETALLLQQKKAVEITETIGALELEKKGVSDVATAVTKATGISVEEGTGNIFVRGLGDRYNSTTLNGLPVASNDPKEKNIDLAIFSTDLVEYIGIEKVYNTRNFGDVAGANIDINSRTHTGKGFFKIGLGAGINTNAISNDLFRQDMPSSSFLGQYNAKVPISSLNQYNFSNSLNPQEMKNPINTNFSLAGGKSYDVGTNGKLNFYAFGGFENDYGYRDAFIGVAASNGEFATRRLNAKISTYDTRTTLYGNLNYKFNKNNQITFNSLYINSSNLKFGKYEGLVTQDITEGLMYRADYVKNALWLSQLIGENKLNDHWILNWSGSYNLVNSDMPDRRQNIYDTANNKIVNSRLDAALNQRYFQYLKEEEYVGRASISYLLNKTEKGNSKGKFTLGYEGRMKDRSFDATQFNLRLDTNFANTIADSNNPDALFNQTNLNNGVFAMTTQRGATSNAIDPQHYRGILTINGTYINVEYLLTEGFTALVGFRYDRIEQYLAWNTNQSSSFDAKFRNTSVPGRYTRDEFMPMLSLKYELNDKQNLRLAASKTYTLPQFKESAPFLYEDIDENSFGNVYLYPSTDYNVDLKWEIFPKKEELISVGVFGKYIENPINRIFSASASNEYSFANTGDWAMVAGAELEINKTLITFNEPKNNLSAGLNLSYMYTNQELDSQKVKIETQNTVNVQFTDEESKLQGASPLLLNADLTYNRSFGKDNKVSATVAYNVFSDRVSSLGTNERNNDIEKSVGTLDFILRSTFGKLGINFLAKNILNPTIERYLNTSSGQDVTINSYKRGVNIGLGLSYQF